MSHSKSYRKFSPRIARARYRAHKHGLPGDLTPEEFARTIAFFHGSCAYCLGPAQTIDHFIPLGAGIAGSTVDNCIPCCHKCNALKSDILPENLENKRFLPERIDTIRSFLFMVS